MYAKNLFIVDLITSFICII